METETFCSKFWLPDCMEVGSQTTLTPHHTHFHTHCLKSFLAELCVCVCVCVCVQSCPPLCDPMDCSLPGSSAMEFSRLEYYSREPLPTPGDPHHPGIKPSSIGSPGRQIRRHWRRLGAQRPSKGCIAAQVCQNEQRQIWPQRVKAGVQRQWVGLMVKKTFFGLPGPLCF